MTLRQGRCRACRVVLEWPASWSRVRDAWCPFCGDKLHATSSECRDGRRLLRPLDSYQASVKRARIEAANG